MSDRVISEPLINNDLRTINIEAYIHEGLPIIMVPKWYKDGVMKLVLDNRDRFIPTPISVLVDLPWIKNNVPVDKADKLESLLETTSFKVGINSKTKYVNYIEIIESA